MPDWTKFVQARLSQNRHGAQLEDEVVQELADYLEDAAEVRTPTAIPQQQGIDAIAAEVTNWPRLARQINTARGGTMVKQRTLTMWLPGVVSTTAAFLLLCASQKIGAQPRIVEVSPRMAMMIYIGWLFLLPAFGAFAAWWSRRAGGSISNRLMAAVFPVFSMVAIYLVIFSSAMLTTHGLDVPNLFRSLASALVLGVFVPATALSLGALPYLKKTLPYADAR